MEMVVLFVRVHVRMCVNDAASYVAAQVRKSGNKTWTKGYLC